MEYSKKDIEIMAPAGNFEALHAAIDAGADSVYFGVGNLNMRSHSANNFTVGDLPEVCRICRDSNVKSYLTLNIVLYDEDLAEMKRTVAAAKDAGITAIIASDMAAILAARQAGVEVHISTQLSISNIESLKFYSGFADVVVLARELNLGQVKAISRAIKEENVTGPSGKPVGIEMFCHGALCMAVSGKCYLSLHEYNASANRGACYQLCRRGYEVTDLETGRSLVVDNKYIMSPKDLCTIEFMDKMLDAGVRVFKIEGRARATEYVSYVVSAYREAADAIFNIVFYITLTSMLIQGTTFSRVARWMGLSLHDDDQGTFIFNEQDDFNSELQEIDLANPDCDGQPIMSLGLPEGALVVYVKRGKQYITPRGNTEVKAGDKLLVMSNDAETMKVAKNLLSGDTKNG